MNEWVNEVYMKFLVQSGINNNVKHENNPEKIFSDINLMVNSAEFPSGHPGSQIDRSAASSL